MSTNQDSYLNICNHLTCLHQITTLIWETWLDRLMEEVLICLLKTILLQVHMVLPVCRNDWSSNLVAKIKKGGLMAQVCFHQGKLILRFHIETKTILWNKYLEMAKSSHRNINMEIWPETLKGVEYRTGPAPMRLKMVIILSPRENKI